MKRYKYSINNLDCAHCAKKIEDELSKDNRLKNVIVNFSTLKLSFDAESDISLKELNSVISKIDSKVSVSDNSNKNKNKEYHFVVLLIGFLFGFLGVFLNNNILSEIFILFSYLIH